MNYIDEMCSKSGLVTEAKTKRDEKLLKRCPYLWVPANCQQVDGEWYFNIEWAEHPNGWTGVSMCKAKLFYTLDGKCTLLNKKKKSGSLFGSLSGSEI